MALTNRPSGRLMLSERLRNMRFMKERQETDFRAKLEQEQIEREKAAHWTLEADGTVDTEDLTPLVIEEESIGMPDVSRRVGRHSFGNFNAVVEKRNCITTKPKSESVVKKPFIKEEGKIDEENTGGMALETHRKAPGRIKEETHLDTLSNPISPSNLLSKNSSSSLASRFPLNAGKRSFKGHHNASQKRSRKSSSYLSHKR